MRTTTPITTTSSNDTSSACDDLGCTALSWCTGRFDPPTVAVAAGGGHLVVYRYADAARAWQSVLQLRIATAGSTSSSSSSSKILDVAWAPNVGRRYHSVAAAHEAGVTVYQLDRRSGGGSSNSSQNNNKDNNATTNAPAILSQQEIPLAATWRCQWNVTGTVLATSGDGGQVRLFKKQHEYGKDGSSGGGTWKCVGKIQGDLHQAAAAAGVAASGGGVSMMETTT